jgi:signal transduction histidine kinase
MTGMRERAMLIGADLSVESAPGAGVTVRLRLAL